MTILELIPGKSDKFKPNLGASIAFDIPAACLSIILSGYSRLYRQHIWPGPVPSSQARAFAPPGERFVLSGFKIQLCAYGRIQHPRCLRCCGGKIICLLIDVADQGGGGEGVYRQDGRDVWEVTIPLPCLVVLLFDFIFLYNPHTLFT